MKCFINPDRGQVLKVLQESCLWQTKKRETADETEGGKEEMECDGEVME